MLFSPGPLALQSSLMRASPSEAVPHSMAILKSEDFQSDSNVSLRIVNMFMVEIKLFLDQLNKKPCF